MNEKFQNLFKLFERVTEDVSFDVMIDNHWGRNWNPIVLDKFVYMQDKGERMLREVPDDSEFEDKINTILNNMDGLWREAKGKGLI